MSSTQSHSPATSYPLSFQSTAASLPSLFARRPLFSIACSLFSENTRVGVPRFPFRPPTVHYRLLTHPSPLTTFRMNTCKSVSKQMTLTTFRMNTYVKGGRRGCPASRWFSDPVPGAHRILRRLARPGCDGPLRETFPRTPSYIKASTCRDAPASLASSKARSGKEKFRHERSSLPTH